MVNSIGVILFMWMARPPPFPKKPESSEKLFYHFKIDPATYVLFDSDLSTAIAYGSKNLVSATIINLPKSVTIFYYEPDTNIGWKMKRRYKPDNTTELVDSAKNRVEEKKSDSLNKS